MGETTETERSWPESDKAVEKRKTGRRHRETLERKYEPTNNMTTCKLFKILKLIT